MSTTMFEITPTGVVFSNTSSPSPVGDGDLWYDGTHLNFSYAGGTATKDLLSPGSMTLATNSGLNLTSGVLSMGTPSTITSSTTNSVTGHTHTHAISGIAGGNFSGPASSVADNFISFADTTGKLGADSGYNAASFDTAGSAATVQSNLNTHAGLTTTAHGGIVPSSRTVNSKPLSSDVVLNASDVGAQPAGTYLQSITGSGALSFTSGVNPTGSIATASATIDGVLAHTDWSTFYGKQNPATTLAGYGITDAVQANVAITGATHVKITYDSKGLVTAGSDATTADIAASTNKNYVTDAQAVVIGNTSGTNSGDETTSTIKTKLGAATDSLDGYMTAIDHTALTADNAKVSNVQSDWNASSGLAVILNKPTIPATQVNSDWNAVSGVAEILNKPSIPSAQVQTDWNATSGLGVLLNKPTLGGAASLNVGTTTGTVAAGDDIRLFIDPGQCELQVTGQAGDASVSASPLYGANVALYDVALAAWARYTVSSGGVSLSVSGMIAAALYDLFLYNNSGSPALTSQAWASASTRLISLATQDGVRVKSNTGVIDYYPEHGISGNIPQ